jgi:ribosomal protein S18 acetylase RimI-like enzyme
MQATLTCAPSLGCAPRAVTTGDIGCLSGVLARAFADDPMVRWFARQDERREARARRLFDWYLRDAVPHGLCTTTDALDGAAVWCPPGGWTMPLWRQAALLPTILGITGVTNAPSRIAGVDLLSRKHPPRPHYYLAVVGVEPELQGQGIGSALLQPVLDLCDRTRTGAYLENTKEQNLPLYERHGFRVVEEITMPRGPRQWLMWREPQG